MEVLRTLFNRFQRCWNRTGFSVLQISGKENYSKSSNKIWNQVIYKLSAKEISLRTFYCLWNLMSREKSILLKGWLENVILTFCLVYVFKCCGQLQRNSAESKAHELMTTFRIHPPRAQPIWYMSSKEKVIDFKYFCELFWINY